KWSHVRAERRYAASGCVVTKGPIANTPTAMATSSAGSTRRARFSAKRAMPPLPSQLWLTRNPETMKNPSTPIAPPLIWRAEKAGSGSSWAASEEACDQRTSVASPKRSASKLLWVRSYAAPSVRPTSVELELAPPIDVVAERRLALLPQDERADRERVHLRAH